MFFEIFNNYYDLTIRFVNRSAYIHLTIALIVIYLLLQSPKKFHRKTRKHVKKLKYIKEASDVLNTISKIEHDGQVINYLKKINPYVFEEAILTALERDGHSITRNKKYSNDGGIDGKVVIDGEEHIIQAKRYGDFIQKKHVVEFVALCENMGVKGLFIHTGKTGGGSNQANKPERCTVISGTKLVKLLKSKPDSHI